MSIARSGVIVAVLALAACGSDPVVTPTTESALSSSPAPVSRPSELSLTGVDACSLLTDTQLDQLKVNSKPRKTAEGCSFDADLTKPYYSYGVTPVAADLEAWVSGDRRKSSMTVEPVQVDGFPALRNYRASADPSDCETLVGVAKGQTMVVQAFPVSGGFGQQQLCDMSQQAAELALRTLKARP
ncbi:DUF3558 domain-containing protein [Amycolatopsis sp. NPDC059657]|uniref:DUF3558 domain-containing protein n=1 Tax=Amycolatopsis sp. NPDC059657 TaxID=3346899 RepID=UPI00366D2C31